MLHALGRMRVLGVVALAGVALFLPAAAAAAWLYPGGTWCDPSAIGHRFWGNFVCDLLHASSLNGRPNPGAAAARLGMFALIGSMASLFGGLPSLWPARRRVGVAIRCLGLLATLGMIGVPLLPSDRYGAWHGVAVMAAGGPGFVAVALALHAQLRAPSTAATGRVGVAALAVSAIDMALYVHHWSSRSDCSTLLPIVQRFAMGLTLAWMVASARDLIRSRV